MHRIISQDAMWRPRQLEDEGSNKQAHLVGRRVAGVKMTSKLFDKFASVKYFVPDDVSSVLTAMDVLRMRVHQHDIITPRRQLPQQPEIVADDVTWLRAVDNDDVTRGSVAVLSDELCN